MTVEPTQRLADLPEAAASLKTLEQRPTAQVSKKPDPGVQFEAFFLQTFIQSVLPQDATEVFGEGTAGEMWKSLLSEKIAMQFAEAGGVGIAKMIAPKGGTGGGEAARAGLTAGRLLDLQMSASAQSAATGAPPPVKGPDDGGVR